jgi:hypothetical protein
LKIARPSPKFPWNQWPNVALKEHLVLKNWPTGIPPPGAGFDLKSLALPALQTLCQPWLDAQAGKSARHQVKISHWPQGISFAELLCAIDDNGL